MAGTSPAMPSSRRPLVLESAEGAAEEFAEFAARAAPGRRRRAVGIGLVGVAVVGTIATIVTAIARVALRWALGAGGGSERRRFDPACRAAIGILYLYPARLARDHPHLPASGERVHKLRLHRRRGPHIGGAGDHACPFVLFGGAIAGTHGVLTLPAVGDRHAVRAEHGL